MNEQTLAEFLLARIAEDERVARVADIGVGHGVRPDELWTITNPPRGEVCAMPRRVLAECEAKRRIVGSRPAIGTAGPALHLVHDEVERQRDYVFRLLALPYADHPDYREDWRP